MKTLERDEEWLGGAVLVWSTKRMADLVDDLDLLIGDLCQEWGFCNQLRASELIEDRALLTAEDFACAVLQAEGMNTEFEPGWRRRIRNKFIKRYGSSVSEASYNLQSKPS